MKRTALFFALFAATVTAHAQDGASLGVGLFHDRFRDRRFP